MHRVLNASLLVLLITTASCTQNSSSSSPSASSAASAAPPASGSASAPTSGVQAAPVAIDPRLAEKFKAGASCKWSEEGLMQMCAASDDIEKLVKANLNDAMLDSCLAAMKDPAPSTRAMAGSCVYRYHFDLSDAESSKFAGRVFDAVLPLIEKETDSSVRAAMGWGLRGFSAPHVKKVDAVLATIKKLDPMKDGPAVDYLLDTAFDAYLMQATDEPSKDAVDLALQLAKTGSRGVRRTAYGLLAAAPSRAADGCPVLVGGIESDKDMWVEAVGAFSRLEEKCQAQIDAAAAAIVSRFEKAADPKRTSDDEIDQVGELRSFVKLPGLAKEQRGKIIKAAEKAAGSPKASAREKELIKLVVTDARDAGKAKKN